MNEIVKYRNELNKVALRNFKSKELDLFIAIISRMRDKEEEVTFSFDYLKNLIQYETSNSIETFHKELKSMYNKLIKMCLRLGKLKMKLLGLYCLQNIQ